MARKTAARTARLAGNDAATQGIMQRYWAAEDAYRAEQREAKRAGRGYLPQQYHQHPTLFALGLDYWLLDERLRELWAAAEPGSALQFNVGVQSRLAHYLAHTAPRLQVVLRTGAPLEWAEAFLG